MNLSQYYVKMKMSIYNQLQKLFLDNATYNESS